MKPYLIISAMGKDKPGLVSRLSQLIIQHKGNIDDSRMTALAGEFAIILKISGKSSDLDLLEQNLQSEMPVIGLDYISRISKHSDSIQDASNYDISVLSIDNPGIVNQITQYFSDLDININALQTDSYPAPHTGTQMFSMQITISLANSSMQSDLKDNFIELCDSLNLDATFEAKS